PRALLFSAGYMANLGVAGALLTRGDRVLEDRLNHASLLDAGLLCGARFQRFPHADVNALQRQLTVQARRTLVMTDGVFSMDGDVAPLPALARVSEAAGAFLMVDDAHGFGVLGAQGRGTLEHFDLGMTQVPVLMATLGKALGSFGAFVAGSEALIETLIQRARTYIYTTASPACLAEATRAALRLVQTESWRREKLHALIVRFRSGTTQMNLPLMDSPTAIQPLLIGDAARAMTVSDALRNAGILAIAIRPPTVPDNSARLRITLSAAHTEEHIDRLLEALDRTLNYHV
ncbi:MAG: aminotransferase class I/II-fold pyridoxal phosphate-dependent enzyme, partial [Gammaproteobacteria bacterium]